jgi:hypothetical protein
MHIERFGKNQKMISARFRFDADGERNSFTIVVTVEASSYFWLMTSELITQKMEFERMMKERHPNEELGFRYYIESPLGLNGFVELEELEVKKGK